MYRYKKKIMKIVKEAFREQSLKINFFSKQ